jgi:hypothetical protein
MLWRIFAMSDHAQPAPHGAGEACSPAWDALIRTPERWATISPAELMPIFQGMMRGGCKACPSAQTRVCQNLEKPFAAVGHDRVAPLLGMPWQFKAEDVLAGGASDGTVPVEAIERLVREAEAIAVANGHSLVSMGDLVEAIARLADGWAYRPGETPDAAFEAAVAALGTPTEAIARVRRESKARAEAYRANPEAVRLNAEEIRQGLPFEAPVHDLLASRELTWCNHLPHLLTRLLSRVELEESELLALVELGEAVARERQHPGVTPRDLETGLLRAVAAGIQAS